MYLCTLKINNMSLSGGQLAGGNSTTEKADNDFYATNPQTVRDFLNIAKTDFEDVKIIWENFLCPLLV